MANAAVLIHDVKSDRLGGSSVELGNKYSILPTDWHPLEDAVRLFSSWPVAWHYDITD